MNIVVLDKCTVTNGDIDISVFERFGVVSYYDSLAKADIIRAVGSADMIICNKSEIDSEVIAAAPKLKYIGLFATGYNNIDLEAAKAHGAVVCNVPGYSTDAVAQATFSLLLNLAGSNYKYINSVANGDWKRYKQFSYFPYPITELAGKTFGIYGLGTIGIAVAKIANAFNMNVIAYSRTPKAVDGVRLVSSDELFKTSDVLSIHCPLNEQTAGIVNSRTLSMMKPTAFLINTARGGCINEYDLAQALNGGVIAGAGLDVLTTEPMAEDCPLFGAKNCIMTPHIAWAPFETRLRLIERVCENIDAFVNGKPINVVNR